MNRYLKLVHYEFKRFRYLYFALFAITLLCQCIGLFWFTQNFMNDVNETMETEGITLAEYAAQHSSISYYDYISSSLWFMGPIAFCIAALLIYVFLIWYRDWLGKNMFIYRLLMLPTVRANIYLAKLSVILLAVWGLIAFQLVILLMQKALFHARIPEILSQSYSLEIIITHHPLLKMLIPHTFTEFILMYGMGILCVIIVFTAILLERSYRWKGVLGGIAYACMAGLLFLLPIRIWGSHHFYPSEFILIALVFGLCLAGISLWLSFYLLHRKITV